ncbi:MAG: SDR family oxidoreductase [Promethearchaeota archaeon]
MNIVITGSSKGIGKALARKFLKFGDKVIICSRSQETVESTVAEFKKEFESENVFGIPCNVVQAEDVEQLIAFSVEKFGTIDIWINNAGTAGNRRVPLIDLEVSEIKRIIETNIIGTLLCCRAVLKFMIAQGHGHIFNMEGLGSKGRTQANSLVYATSKSAIPMIKKTLLLETKHLTVPVGIHDLCPGMVLTDLLLRDNPDIKTKKVFNILAEKPETVANYLVPRIRKVKGTGKAIAFLTGFGVMIRFITARKAKNKFFDEEGNRVD